MSFISIVCKICATEMKCQKTVARKGRIRNQQIREELKIESTVEFIEQNKLGYL